MGHIDHGKSTLLDYIRKTNIVEGEAGGITQHVGAYEAEYTSKDGIKRKITFLDTPGHEAFCSIRERGATIADIAILVVSAEDGVKPQTIEALNTIKNSNIPYIVAINKIDKPNADIDRTKQSLGENEIYVEGWGGNIPCVSISSVKGTGIDELMDLVLLSADLAELKTDPNKHASGFIVESEIDKKKGISATLVIKDGTLNTQEFIVSNDSFTPVRYIEDVNNKKIDSASASMPIVIVGWNKIPSCGQRFSVVNSKKEAEKMTEEYITQQLSNRPANTETSKKTKDKDTEGKDANDEIVLPIMIKADSIGSLDGIKHELGKIKNDKVKINIVDQGIGLINENNIKLTIANPKVMILGFGVDMDDKARAMVERSAIPLTVKSFDIIYELTDFVRQKVSENIPKEYIEQVFGKAKILAFFSREKDRQIVGGKVQEGSIETGATVKIIRRDTEIARGIIKELQQQKKKVSEINEGYEFGAQIESKIDIVAGDRIEAFRIIEK
jgi:translation initiation factor IF-2